MGSIFTWSQAVLFKVTTFPDLVPVKELIALFQVKKETNLKKKIIWKTLTGYKILLLVYSYPNRRYIFSSFSIFMTIIAQDFHAVLNL